MCAGVVGKLLARSYMAAVTPRTQAMQGVLRGQAEDPWEQVTEPFALLCSVRRHFFLHLWRHSVIFLLCCSYKCPYCLQVTIWKGKLEPHRPSEPRRKELQFLLAQLVVMIPRFMVAVLWNMLIPFLCRQTTKRKKQKTRLGASYRATQLQRVWWLTCRATPTTIRSRTPGASPTGKMTTKHAGATDLFRQSERTHLLKAEQQQQVKAAGTARRCWKHNYRRKRPNYVVR